MLTRSFVCSIALFASLSSSAFAGSSQKEPDTVDVFGGEVWTSATYDDKGILDTLTLNLSLQSLLEAPMHEMRSFIISLPDEVKKQSFFHYVSVDWNPHGHPPLDVYTLPHFDFHFYHPSPEEVKAFDCTDLTSVSVNKIPAGYALPPASDPEACVPSMGVHALPIEDLQPDFKFEETLIYGYYGAEMIFLEPMITQQFFMDKKELASTAIEVPVGLLPSTQLLPRSYSVRFDAEKDLYQIIFADFAK